MAVIREDVVSIGFDVETNPFADLTAGINEIKAKLGILDDTTGGLNDVADGARTAADDVENLVDRLRAPPENDLAGPINEAEDAAGNARDRVTDLTSELRNAGDQRLTDPVDDLDEQAENPIKKFKDLARQAKTFAKEKLDEGIRRLPPQLQLGIRAGEKLLGALGKVAKMTFKTAVSGIKAIASHGASAAKTLGKVSVKGLVTGITAASVAVAGIGTAAITVGAGFEASMSQVAATMGMSADEANYSNEQYAMLANTAKEMGAATKFSAAQSAEALNYMALAGYDAEKACSALPTVLNLASAGGMELAAASDMVTDSMSALGIEATQENLAEFGDKLAKTAQKSNTSVAQLGEAVLTVGGTAKTLSGGTTELNTLLGIIADNGVKGAEGGTALRNIMLSLQAPTDIAAKKMKSLGLSVYDAEGKMRPMNDILNDLNSSMDGMTDQQKQDAISTIFNKNDLKSVNALLANSGARYDELSGYVSDSAGAMENMAKTMNDNLTGKITEFKSAAEGAGIAIYEALGSSNLKGLVQEASGWITELTKATEEGGIDGLVSQIGTTLSKVLVTITGYLPQLIQAGVSIINSLISGVLQNRDQITSSIITGITTMLAGIIQMLPQLVSGGIAMLVSLLQGMQQQLPVLITIGLSAIQNLCNSLIANAPAIVQSGLNIILQLVQGLIAALPTILTTGIQLVITLAQGLIAAIPDLIAMIPQLISAIIVTLMSVDWIKLGLDIIKGVGEGLVKGIKGLFSKGKDAGKEVGDGLTEGLNESTSEITAAADETAKAAAEGMQPDTVQLSDYGVQTSNSFAGGITAGSTAVSNAALTTSSTALSGFAVSQDTQQIGAMAANNMALGINSNLGSITDAAANMGSQITEAAQPEKLDSVPQSFSESFSDANVILDNNLTAMKANMDTSMTDMLGKAAEFAGSLKKTFEGINLFQTGSNIMSGLNKGMLSKRENLMATAKGIALGITNTINEALDIHSPSGITEESGEFTGMGLAKGIKKTSGRVQDAAGSISDTAAKTIQPFRSRYSPEAASGNNSHTINQQNSYNPVFNLTLNGASASDSNERKIRRWVKEEMKAAIEGMGRTNPRLQEV